MAFVQQPWPQTLLTCPPGGLLLYRPLLPLHHFSPPPLSVTSHHSLPPLLLTAYPVPRFLASTLSLNMADQSIYYMFSRHVLCLEESNV